MYKHIFKNYFKYFYNSKIIFLKSENEIMNFIKKKKLNETIKSLGPKTRA